MGWLRSTVCGILLTTALSLGVPGQDRLGVWDAYRKNIEYQNLSEIDFTSLQEEKVPIPKELEMKIKYRKEHFFRIKNQKLLEELIFEEVEKLGVKKAETTSLHPEKAIKLSMEVTASVFDYFLVDGKEFIAEHGASLPIEEYMQLRQGDCDKYTDVAVLAFNLFKENNPHLKNIYLLNDSVGPIEKHIWVTAVMLDNNRIITTSLDPTFYDNGNGLEGKEGTHIPKNNLVRLADFYSLLEDTKGAYLLIEEILQDKTVGEEVKERLLSNLFFEVYWQDDREKMESIRKHYLELENKNRLDEVLYYSYEFETEEKNSEAAEAYKNWLLTDFPDSDWTKKLKENIE
jgi:hypothetical protein